MDFTRDYYKILGVKETATKEEIKAAYRKLAIKHHPDRNNDSKESNEILKLINEAKEVLLDDTARLVYDEYRKDYNEKQRKEEIPSQENQNKKTSPHQKTYTRKKTETKEHRVFLKGKIVVKFYAEQDNALTESVVREVYHKMFPTEAFAVIEEQQIYSDEPPYGSINNTVEANSLFQTAIPQPVKCTLKARGGNDDFYYLNIFDLRISNPHISNVSKYDGNNFGTVEGDFHGYIVYTETVETEVTVTECSGATGNTEFKTEEGKRYGRVEFYHADCSTYWGPWVELEKEKTAEGRSTGPGGRSEGGDWGCSSIIGLLSLLLLLVAAPKFFLGLLILGLIIYLLSVPAIIVNFLAPLFRILLFVFLLSVIISTLKGCDKTDYANDNSYRKPPEKNKTIKRSRDPVTVKDSANYIRQDTIISHYLEWRSYDNSRFSGKLTVLSSVFKEAYLVHNGISYTPVTAGEMGVLYDSLLRNQEKQMAYVFRLFDSIQTTRHLNRRQFAECIVSCIQSIPYYLVLDNSCSQNEEYDEYTNWFLSNCKDECCIGYEKYGVRTPAEFLSDLKGDCDTRSLLIYAMLKKYEYPVALLVSEQYKHALIAANLGTSNPEEGLYMRINGQNYYLWETTSFGFKPGQIPDNISNLNYWDISLLSD